MRNWPIIFLLLTTITESSEISLNREYLEGYVSDTKSILSPSSWNLKKALLVTGITGGLYAYDQHIQDFSQENRSDTSNKIASFAKPFGDGRYTLPPLGLLYLYGQFSNDRRFQRVSLLCLESFVLSGIFTQAIKFMGHRHRPNTGAPWNTWDGPSFSTSNLSFPSGHSSSAFSVATVIAEEYNNVMFVPQLAYGIATLTALSRVNDNAHWASDVFLGSCIGYFIAKAIVDLHGKKDRSLTISPNAISLVYNF